MRAKSKWHLVWAIPFSLVLIIFSVLHLFVLATQAFIRKTLEY